MNWFEWTLICWLIFGALASISMIGKHRDPLTPGTALLTLIINGLLVAGLVAYR